MRVWEDAALRFLWWGNARPGRGRLQPTEKTAPWLIESHYSVARGTVNCLGPMLFWVETGLAGSGFIRSESVLREAGIVGLDFISKE